MVSLQHQVWYCHQHCHIQCYDQKKACIIKGNKLSFYKILKKLLRVRSYQPSEDLLLFIHFFYLSVLSVQGMGVLYCMLYWELARKLASLQIYCVTVELFFRVTFAFPQGYEVLSVKCLFLSCVIALCENHNIFLVICQWHIWNFFYLYMEPY